MQSINKCMKHLHTFVLMIKRHPPPKKKRQKWGGGPKIFRSMQALIKTQLHYKIFTHKAMQDVYCPYLFQRHWGSTGFDPGGFWLSREDPEPQIHFRGEVRLPHSLFWTWIFLFRSDKCFQLEQMSLFYLPLYWNTDELGTYKNIPASYCWEGAGFHTQEAHSFFTLRI